MKREKQLMLHTAFFGMLALVSTLIVMKDNPAMASSSACAILFIMSRFAMLIKNDQQDKEFKPKKLRVRIHQPKRRQR